MKYKSPKKPGDLIRKVNASKRHKLTVGNRTGKNTAPYFPQARTMGSGYGQRPSLQGQTQTLQGGAAMPNVPGIMRAKKRATSKKKHYKKKKTVSVSYEPGNYKEGEEIKAIRALDEMHKGIKAKKHRKNWIQGAIKHPGALHRQLGIKSGHKIPAKTLARAASKGGTLGRRARLAQTLKGLHK